MVDGLSAEFEIPSDRLTPDDVPDPDSATWGRIAEFGCSWDGYRRGGFHRCGDLTNGASDEFEATGELPSSLDGLRTCLFFEQRRHHHFSYPPHDRKMVYIRALVRAVVALAAENTRGKP